MPGPPRAVSPAISWACSLRVQAAAQMCRFFPRRRNSWGRAHVFSSAPTYSPAQGATAARAGSQDPAHLLFRTRFRDLTSLALGRKAGAEKQAPAEAPKDPAGAASTPVLATRQNKPPEAPRSSVIRVLYNKILPVPPSEGAKFNARVSFVMKADNARVLCVSPAMCLRRPCAPLRRVHELLRQHARRPCVCCRKANLRFAIAGSSLTPFTKSEGPALSAASPS